MAKSATENSAFTEQLMEEVCDRENLERACKRVKRNKESPGVDGMTIDDAKAFLRQHWPNIQSRLLDGNYRPQPVKRVEIPKPGRRSQETRRPLCRRPPDSTSRAASSSRAMGSDIFGAQFRISAGVVCPPGCSPGTALRYNVVADLDLEGFFDRVNHDILMSRVAARIPDKRMLKLIRAFLNAGVLEDGLVRPVDEETPQGDPLSPFLSNIVLDDLDKELARRGHRYADDCNIYVRSHHAGERVRASISQFMTDKLRKKVNEAKSAAARPEQRKFLGVSIANDGSERRIAPKALDKFKDRIREITCWTRGISLQQMIADLKPYLIGWRGYFGFCQTPRVLTNLEAWIRRRMRLYLGRQWRNGHNRFTELRGLGIAKVAASVAADSPTGLWRMSGHPAVQHALQIMCSTLLISRIFMPVPA